MYGGMACAGAGMCAAGEEWGEGRGRQQREAAAGLADGGGAGPAALLRAPAGGCRRGAQGPGSAGRRPDRGHLPGRLPDHWHLCAAPPHCSLPPPAPPGTRRSSTPAMQVIARSGLEGPSGPSVPMCCLASLQPFATGTPRYLSVRDCRPQCPTIIRTCGASQTIGICVLPHLIAACRLEQPSHPKVREHEPTQMSFGSERMHALGVGILTCH